MKRRHTLALLAGALLAPWLAQAQPADPDAPIVRAPKIVEALNPKDIRLDQPGTAPRPPRRDPSIALRVQFAFDSADLTARGQQQLDELAAALNNKALVTSGFELVGHTDRVGDAEYNLRLSLDRANAVKLYLVGRHGIAPERLLTVGMGYARPADAANPTAAVNRRVEVRRILVAVPAAPANGHGSVVPTPR